MILTQKCNIYKLIIIWLRCAHSHILKSVWKIYSLNWTSLDLLNCYFIFIFETFIDFLVFHLNNYHFNNYFICFFIFDVIYLWPIYIYISSWINQIIGQLGFLTCSYDCHVCPHTELTQKQVEKAQSIVSLCQPTHLTHKISPQSQTRKRVREQTEPEYFCAFMCANVCASA